MRISEAISESTPIAVPFAAGAVLNIEYRPSSVTLAQMEDMVFQAEKAAEEQAQEASAQDNSDTAQLRRLRERLAATKQTLADNILTIVTKWDLEEEDGTTVPLTIEGLANVPNNVFREIIRAVRQHQSAGDEGK
jgi:hypothetical protein